MPRLLRQKVLAFPLPNLLPVLPPQFAEKARARKMQLEHNDVPSSSNGAQPRTSGKQANGKHKEQEEQIAVTEVGGMDVDELGSTADGTIADSENDPALKITTPDESLEDLPAPDEEDVVEFLRIHTDSRHRADIVDYQSQLQAALGQKDPSKSKEWKEPEVYVIQETGEIFLNYSEYINRISFYKQNKFTSDNNVQHGALPVSDFFEALSFEKSNSIMAQNALPETLKRACLRAVQFSMEGRLEVLCDKTYNRFSQRFFPLEKVFVDLGKDTYFANVAEVIPPTTASTSGARKGKAQNSGPHAVAMDSSIEQEQADKIDDPASYRYKLQLITSTSLAENATMKAADDSIDKWGDLYVEVESSVMSRDRIAYSRIAVKKFLKDSIQRDAAIGSAWLVNETLARKYQVTMQMSAKVQKHCEAEKGKQLEKRRGYLIVREPIIDETTDGPPNKKQKTDHKRKSKAEKEEEERLRAEELARIEAENNKRKKPTKFPAEDYLIEYTSKDQALGKAEKRPSFTKNLPFPSHMETFLLTWNFMNAFSKLLDLSPFTIDEYENALYHTNPLQPCILLQEIHQTLLNVVRQDAVRGQEQVLPFKAAVPLPVDDESSDESDDEDEDKQERERLVAEQAASLAATFLDREAGGGRAGRRDWEGMLVGCLWQRGHTHTVPNISQYLQGILLEADNAPTNRPTWSAASMRPRITKNLSARYLALHSVFKLEIISFLCELAVQTKVIRDHFEQSSLALSKCRNDQLAAKRDLARIRGERPEGESDGKEDAEETPSIVPDPEALAESSDDLSEPESETSTDRGKRSRNNAALRKKAVQAKQAQKDAEAGAREAAAKLQKASDKAKKAEKEEEKRLVERIADLGREFRRQYNAMRTYPIGQDRFLNTIWWLDGCGTVELVGSDGEIVYGTGRLYIQAPKQEAIDRHMAIEELTLEEVQEKHEQGEPIGEPLEDGEWATIDTVKQLELYLDWLTEKGRREQKLLKALIALRPLIEAGMQKRGEMYTPEPEVEDQGTIARRQKRHVLKSQFRSSQSYLNYKNTLR